MPKIYDQITDQVQPDLVKPTEGMYFHTKEVAVLYPLLQSVVSGILFGIAVLSFFLFMHWPRAWEVGALSFALSQLAIWTWSVLRWNSWVHQLEKLIGLDLNRNGVIGYPREPLRIELIEDTGRKVTFIDLPGTDEQLAELANGLLQGAPFSEGQWTGAGRPFSRAEFLALRDEMLDRGLITWNNINAHAQGMQLTRPGSAVMRQLLLMGSRMPPSPTPRARSGAN